MKKVTALILTLILSSILFAGQTFKVSFTLGKITVFDGKKTQVVQLNQILNEKDFIRIPKGAALTLTLGTKQIKIKGENQFRIKELMDNINQWEEFLNFSSKRKEISNKLIHRAQPSPNLGVRAEEEKENPTLKWSDEIPEKNTVSKEKKEQDSAGKIRENYYKGEYEGTLLLISENPGILSSLKNTDSSFYIGASYYFLGDYQESVTHLDHYLKSQTVIPTLGSACLYLKALAHFSLGQYQKSADTLENFFKMYESSASEPDIYLLLAKAYHRAGKKKEKERILSQIEIKFDSKTLAELKEEILELKK